jgi:hypothetical protein
VKPVTRRRVAVVRARLEQMTGEMPSTEGGGGKGSHSDRTGNLAFRHTLAPSDPRVDIALRDMIEMDRLVQRITARMERQLPFGRDLAALEVILATWEPLNERQVDGLRSKGDDSGAGWCQSHWARGATRPPRSPGGRLCQFCENWLRVLNDPEGEWGLALEVLPQSMIDRNALKKHVTERDLPPKRRK